MPVAAEHPQFQVLSYRTPRGARNQGDIALLNKDNEVSLGILSDVVIGCTHTGTHIDALSHVACGQPWKWYGGFEVDSALGDFGPLHCDAGTIPPIVTRGVLVDVAKHLGVQALERSYAISADLVDEVLQARQVEVRPNDAVLVRTGYMSVWPGPERSAYAGAGIDHSAAVLLAERGAVLVGGDTEGLEVHPSGDPSNPLPAHIELLVKRGIYIMELANLEELSADNVTEFCFVCLPLRIHGATGAMVRPIALV
jgi:kynurenine formamidase